MVFNKNTKGVIELPIDWNNKYLYQKENKIYGYEPYFRDFVCMAFLDHNVKEVRPAHGYFLPIDYKKITFTMKTLNTPIPFIAQFFKYKIDNN